MLLLEKISESKSYPIIILLFLSFIWGSSFILIKRGLDVFSPLQVGSIRVSFAFILLLPFALKYIKSVFRLKWKQIIIYGLLANFIPAILFAFAETGLSSSLTGILNSLTPMFTLLIGAMFFGISIHKQQTVGLAAGFVGSFLLSFIGSGGDFGSFNFYALFVVAATVCYGVSSNLVIRYFRKIDSLALTALAFFSLGGFALIYLLSSDFIYKMHNVDGAWTSLSYLFILSAFGTALALILFNRLIQVTTAVFASTVTYLIPITAVVWGIMDGEELYALHFVGMGLIIIGVYVVNRYK
jgi:drug/metabolite transporter (DMT)-like permease